MGVIPTNLAHTSRKRADDRRLCAEIRTPDSASALPRPRYAVPLALAGITGLVLALVDPGPAGWLGGGVAVGIFACATYLRHERRSTLREAHEVHAGELEPISFTWGLHFDGPRARLELQTAMNSESPIRLRVTDRDGQIVAVSSTAVVSLDGTLEFQVEPPLDLIADLDEGREIDHAIEALVEQEWRTVRLKDNGRRTTSVVDVQGRLARVPDDRAASRVIGSVPERRSALN